MFMFTMVSLASPLAVMVVGKKTAVPLVFLGEPPPGDMIVKGDTGMFPPYFEISSMKIEPLVQKGGLTRLAEVGSPCEVIGKAPPTMVWGDGGGRVGVLGREPGMGGAREKGEYTCPGTRRYGSMEADGASRVGVMGVTPLLAHALKKVGLLKIPGEMGMALWGKTNLAASLTPTTLLASVGCWEVGCSVVGGVALPLLIESLL